MTEPTDDLAARARSTFNAAADRYDAPANAFWDRAGRRTVERLGLVPGQTVLDTPCGTGASALHAAAAVAPGGHVIGLDLADGLLALGRAKARARGLTNIDFVAGDMTASGYADGEFDAVLCVFGIFFVPDMVGLARELWRQVRPGGVLAVTTWGFDALEPVYSEFAGAVRRYRPDIDPPYRPPDVLATAWGLVGLLAQAGIEAQAEEEPGEQELPSPESWWDVALGSGLRASIEAVGPEVADRIRNDNIDFVRSKGITHIRTDFVFGAARKPTT